MAGDYISFFGAREGDYEEVDHVKSVNQRPSGPLPEAAMEVGQSGGGGGTMPPHGCMLWSTAIVILFSYGSGRHSLPDGESERERG